MIVISTHLFCFQAEMTTVDDTKENLQLQKLEVTNNIKQINNATLEYEFNNRLTRRICEAARTYNYETYRRWLLYYPILQLFMSNENKVHNNIYHSAAVEGLRTELLSHAEIRTTLEVKYSFTPTKDQPH